MRAAEVITTTAAGRTFRASRRTAAHIAYTIEQLAKQHPSARLVIIQTCFNTGVPQSAGTHDGDACFDVMIVGLDWWAAQRFLRECGWAAWYRYPPTFSMHIHMVSLGYPGGDSSVGVFVPGQVGDYYRHALGLKGLHDSGDDTSWFPPNIDKTIFDYPAWLKAQEAKVPVLNTVQQARVDILDGADQVSKGIRLLWTVSKSRRFVWVMAASVQLGNRAIRAALKTGPKS